MSTTVDSIEVLVLDTGLFNDRDTLSTALRALPQSAIKSCKLEPEKMNDGDWDNILDLVLSTKRVITL